MNRSGGVIPDRTDIYAMCSLCGVCVYNDGAVREDDNTPTSCGVKLDGCLFMSQTELEQSRVFAFRLTSGQVVVVDYEDKMKVLGYAWRANERSGHIHAMVEGKTVQLHRVVTGVTSPDILVDHIHHDVRDNRKSQLREATVAQNRQNTRKRGGATSQYLGVYYDPRRTQWAASIQFKPEGGKRTNRHLGYTDSEWEAAELYNRAAREAYGEFAVLNVERHPVQGEVGGVDRGGAQVV